MKTRFLALLLAMTTMSTVSCAATSSPGTDMETVPLMTSAPAETTTADLTVKTDLPENLTFNGAAYRIHNIDCPSYLNTIVAFEQSGESLNDAIYLRDQKLMQKYDFTFQEFVFAIGTNGALAASTTRNLISSGDDSYDQYVLIDWSGYTLAQEGYALPISALPHVDTTREYWSQSIHSDMSVGGNLYFAFGDHNLTTYDSVNFLLFNKSLAADLGLADHYETVLGGDWTLDAMHANMQAAQNDADGNGVWDQQDVYGITSHSKQVLPVFWIGAGMRVIEKNEEDIPVFALTGNERFANLYEKILHMMHDEHLLYMSDSMPDYANNTLFMESGALYNVLRAAFLKNYREMDIDYGIIPFPKMDADQKEYCSRTEGAYIHLYPVTLKQLELAGAVTEAMACASLNEVIPVYYDVILKNKYARDENSTAMLDLIYGNRFYDLGDTLFCSTIRDGIFAGKFKSNDTNLQSTIQILGRAADKILKNYAEAFPK